MGYAILRGGFPARADALPDADGGGLQTRHGIERDAHAVGQADEF
jgi:hypothetical protein